MATSTCILQITDTHLFSSGIGRLAGVDTRASLAAVLDMALAERLPDLLLVTGDIAQEPHTEAYAALVEEVRARYSGKLICLPGNHDEPELAPELFELRESLHNDWQILTLDSHVPGQEGGEVSAVELDRLAAALAATDARHILVALHHPPLELASPLDHGRVANGTQLLEQLAADGRVRGILFGHVHQSVRLEIGDLMLYGSPSTSVQFKPLVRQFALDTRPPGCRWITLRSDGTIATDVSRLVEGSFAASLQ